MAHENRNQPLGEFAPQPDGYTTGYRAGFVKGYADGIEDGRFQGFADAKRLAFQALAHDGDAVEALEAAGLEP